MPEILTHYICPRVYVVSGSVPADKSKGELVVQEERERGSVSPRVYLAYIKAYSILLFITVFILKMGENASLVGE